LREWQNTSDGKQIYASQRAAYNSESNKTSKGDSNKSQRAIIKSALAEYRKEDEEKASAQEEAKAVLSSIVSELDKARSGPGKPLDEKSVHFATAASFLGKLNTIKKSKGKSE